MHMRRLGAVLMAAALAMSLAACGDDPDPVGFEDFAPSPGAEPYAGPLTAPLDTRLESLVTEFDLTIEGQRVEYLPTGVDYASHLEFRDEHVDELRRTRELIPEPDRPVLLTEYDKDNLRLFVIAVADDAGERLVVLTALTSS